MEGVGHRLLVGFLRQRLSNVVEVCLLVNDCLEIGAVLLQSTVLQSLVCVFHQLIDLLIDLADVHVHLVDVRLGLKDSGQLLD